MRDIVKFVDSKVIEEAEKLGFDEIIVLTDEPMEFKSDIKISTACLAKNKDFAKLPNFKRKYDYLIAIGSRKAFEHKLIDFIIPENDVPKDHTHYRNSGMDQILAKLAKTKRKTILFDISELKKAKNKQLLLGRMMQNARLCKKYKVNSEFVTFAEHPLDLIPSKDLKSFSRILT